MLADEMLEDVIEFACKLAKHRGSQLLARNDVKLAMSSRKAQSPLTTTERTWH